MRTNVVGVTFANEDGSSRARIIESMSELDQVCLERDPYNQYDSNAVKVCVVKNGEKKQIGFVAKDIAAEMSPKMRRGANFKATIVGCGSWNGRPYCELDIQEMTSTQATSTITGTRSFARPSHTTSSASSYNVQTGTTSSDTTTQRVQPSQNNSNTQRTSVSTNTTTSRQTNSPQSSNSGCLNVVVLVIIIATAVIYFL